MPDDAETPAPQREVTTVQVETNRHVNIASISTIRTPTGIDVKIVSPVIEEYFKSQHARISRSSGRAPERYYASADSVPGQAYRVEAERIYLGEHDCYFGHWERSPFDANFSRDGVCNLSIFRAVGLGEGYTRSLPNPLVSRQALQTWVNVATKSMKSLYVEFLKPVEFRITITSEERS
jgi:hypothetical protein